VTYVLGAEDAEPVFVVLECPFTIVAFIVALSVVVTLECHGVLFAAGRS
jgi:hypothetical protein